MITRRELSVFWHLLSTDLKILRFQIADKLIDMLIWVICGVIKSGFILPAFGVSKEFGAFVLVGSCATAGLFEVWPAVIGMVSDFTGEKVISYYFTLPMRSWFVLLRAVVAYATNAALIGIFVLPVGKLILGTAFNFANFSFMRFLLIYVLTSIFYGALTIWLASFMKDISKAGSVWMRFLYPLWILGAFEFSWEMMYNFSPVAGYLSLLNPFIYVMEGIRGAVLDWQGSIPFPFCVLALLTFSTLCAAHGIVRLKKRLDFV
ncbi:MAG: ABC transporter permease [Epsilonproteobacteria bacterium]|nr:ABC transporter permease [Campylobacterota bacterium]